MIKITKKSLNGENIFDVEDIASGCWINLQIPSEKEVDYVIEKRVRALKLVNERCVKWC